MSPEEIQQQIAGLQAEDPCPAAHALAEAKASEALIPLLRAFEASGEDDADCLLEALEQLHAGDEAIQIFAQQPLYKREALALMELFPQPDQQKSIEQALNSHDPRIQQQAVRCVITAERTHDWKKWLARLLNHQDPAIRQLAIQELGLYLDEAEVRQALADRYSVETDLQLHADLKELLGD